MVGGGMIALGMICPDASMGVLLQELATRGDIPSPPPQVSWDVSNSELATARERKSFSSGGTFHGSHTCKKYVGVGEQLTGIFP